MPKFLAVMLVGVFLVVLGCAANTQTAESFKVVQPTPSPDPVVIHPDPAVESSERFVLPPAGSPEREAIMKQLDQDVAKLEAFAEFMAQLKEDMARLETSVKLLAEVSGVPDETRRFEDTPTPLAPK